MMLIKNISDLVVVPPGPVPGTSMKHVRRIADAALLVKDGLIAWYGPQAELIAPMDVEVVDARGCAVVPGLVDCHTHAVFAGSREQEFVQRIQGKSYVEIAESGGGIRSTVAAVRRASQAELVAEAMPRLHRMLQQGTTTVEIKSGYGLTVADELKMLRAARELGQLQPIEIVGTYLAAHTVPAEFAGRADAYLDSVLGDEAFAAIRAEGLAEFADCFCERSAFDVPQCRRFLEACKRHGLIPRVHADQITQMGASKMAAEVGASSADHLEHILDRVAPDHVAPDRVAPDRVAPVFNRCSDESPEGATAAGSSSDSPATPNGGTGDTAGLDAMRKAGTVAVLLPACSMFLGVPQAPARTILEADLPIALATDLNPGSSMVESMQLVMSIACTQMRMTPIEALVAATANAAAAINRQDRLGAIAEGYQADLLILDLPRLEQWPYNVGRNCVRTVVKAGAVAIGGDSSRLEC
jgi:imidazolonepropionase